MPRQFVDTNQSWWTIVHTRNGNVKNVGKVHPEQLQRYKDQVSRFQSISVDIVALNVREIIML